MRYTENDFREFDDVSRAEAERLVGKHSGVGGYDANGEYLDGFAGFLAEVGDRDTYAGDEILKWLGY